MLGCKHHMKAHIMPHGWMAREITGRPKARFFGFLAVIWAAVALIGALLLWLGTPGTESAEIRRLAWLILVPEPIFLSLGIFFRLVEQPRKVPTPRDWEGPVVH
jgi:hypothetical protein